MNDLTQTPEMLIATMGARARRAAVTIAQASDAQKADALRRAAQAVRDQAPAIIAANARDMENAAASGLSAAMLDRLKLDEDRIAGAAAGVEQVASLTNPLGSVIDTQVRPNGLELSRVRVPLGVIGIIYESRPNVTADAGALCLKSGNACLLRGGKESLKSNTALVNLIRDAIGQAGMTPEVVQFVDNTDRALVDVILGMKEHIDLIIPRGGTGLINFVKENAAMPAITGGVGVCHTYVDSAADLDKASNIIFNAKVQRPTVCNALDTVLVHSDVATKCLPLVANALAVAGVELHCDGRALSALGPNPGIEAMPANEDDWGREFLSLTAAVKVVDSLDEALEHIETYGSGHSEAIITEDYSAAMRFLDEVDAAAVFVNASTRFTDGSQLGLGAEVGISTQKFHARGPMGLRELTSYKWVIMGNGQVRE